MVGGRGVKTGSTAPPNTGGLNGRGGWYWVPSRYHPHTTAPNPPEPPTSARHPTPPTCHPTAAEETTCNRTSITFPRTTIFVSVFALGLHQRHKKVYGDSTRRFVLTNKEKGSYSTNSE